LADLGHLRSRTKAPAWSRAEDLIAGSPDTVERRKAFIKANAFLQDKNNQ
jgi:hypothetical protein